MEILASIRWVFKIEGFIAVVGRKRTVRQMVRNAAMRPKFQLAWCTVGDCCSPRPGVVFAAQVFKTDQELLKTFVVAFVQYFGDAVILRAYWELW